MTTRLALLIPVALLVLAGCGGSDAGGSITDRSECEDALTERLVSAYEAGEIPGAEGFDSDEVSEAIEDVLPEYCNEVELGEGVELDDIDSSAEAAVSNELNGGL